ncbi:MAG: cob(I)yrinic acid a,c-diamide adenosyltransferase [Calditrichaeota bacterium]|nr:cob(I)yrinic acid a,c-diamide adenosyltransferase [Calditrichota bacterium]
MRKNSKSRSNLEKGYVQIYTGNGKGKTTAAIGLAVRAVGSGLRVYFAQFMKNYPYGEIPILQSLQPNITIVRWGDDRFVFKKEPPSNELKAEMNRGLNEALQAMKSGRYDVVILDEVLVSVYFKLFSAKQIVDFVRVKPEAVELVLTGRYCPQEIIELADLVTEMREVKHYYRKGILARKGIEN